MTDEEIKKLSKKTRKEKYCNKYNNGETDCSCSCENNECPLFVGIDGWYDFCAEEKHGIGFIDGYKAAFDKLIEKIKDMQK